MILIKTPEEIEKMRKVGRLAGDLLDFLTPYVQEGISTLELNDLAENFTQSHGAISAPLNYNGFPKSICTSINNVVCHGIPSADDVLRGGDIVNIDVTLILDGYHGDTSRTFMIGNVDPEIKKLVEMTEKAMYRGIDAVKPKAMLSDIGKTIEKFLKKYRYGIVEEYCGHGIGKDFHEEPHVLHKYSPHNRIKLKPGMIFTIEPMINMGKSGRIKTSDIDGWTVTTTDGKPSAQFEHTVLVTESGHEILTYSTKQIKEIFGK
ncbi:MAG: type I methionyl aminopeptidase [Candidatus Cloacimonadota bacterium]|nr:MAG: type I methionyl aminopeptidase [Candidatus Cloacimonadota bacterium]